MTKYSIDKENEERFWEKVDKRGPDECWEWQGAKSKGYGVFGISGKHYRAHRASWIINNGPIGDGLCVCHSCDVPSCINPRHLFLGTHQDNMKDMFAKNRNARGETTSSKLTEENVVEIFELYCAGGKTMADLSELFDVTTGQISSILCGESWSHLSNAKMVDEAQKRAVYNKSNSALHGEDAPWSKLTKDKVTAIRYIYENKWATQEYLASLYGVSRRHIGRIVSGQRWKHIT